MEGFIVFDYADEYPTALGQLAQWLAEGKLKRKETILKGGIRVADEGMVNLYKGGNIGKSPHSFTWVPVRNVKSLTTVGKMQVNCWSRSRIPTTSANRSFRLRATSRP